MRSSPFFQGILPINQQQLPAAILAGITLAGLAIPEVMGYTKIAGTPVVTGLYTMLLPMLVFAVLGSSRHLVVGADSATAAIMAGALAGMASPGSHGYVALAGLLAMLAGGILLLARIIGFGFMADFLSRTVLIGFLTGVGVQIAIGQIPGMTGGRLDQFKQFNNYDLLFSGIVIVIIIGTSRISKKIPGALIAVAAAIIAGAVFNFSYLGIATIGAVPQGLPGISLPDVPYSFALIQKLLPTAFSMFVVILAQSGATSRAYAIRYDEEFDQNADLCALAMANMAAGISGNFVVNGSPTKTEMVDSAGGRSQLSQLVTCLVVFLVLLFFTGLMSQLPNAVLSTVVFMIGLRLIDLKGMRMLWNQRPPEFWVALATAVAVVVIGVEQGIVLAMVLSLMEHVRRSYRSQNVVLALDDQGNWKALSVKEPKQALPGLLFYRFAHTIYYANSSQFFHEILELTNQANPALAWFCIDASAVADVDFTAAESIRDIHGVLKARGVRLIWVNVIEAVRGEFDRYQITGLFGQDAFYDNISNVIQGFKSNGKIML